jgi:hypothetical protein
LGTVFEPLCSPPQLEKRGAMMRSKVPPENWIVNLIAVDATPISFKMPEAPNSVATASLSAASWFAGMVT